ncbi:hypothetical protein [Marinitoga sp. 1155]|uniref:hypothetical protein n=1 Tax=Marinitoga sp. 1155 TaxID=1428448 RepID=UPI00065788B8|nr:hypothetical protein [Marinitoga sp. 1155]KLO25122.1 collagen-binding protein [Marinitoga sp. 1155]
MRKNFYTIILLLFSIFLISSCQKIDPLLGNSNIGGVAELSNSENHENIKVSIDGLESSGEGFSPINTISEIGKSITNSNGNFKIENIPAGNYIIKAEHEGYFPTKQFIEVKEESEITLDSSLILYPLGDYGMLEGNVKFIDKSIHSGILLEIRTPEGEPLPGMFTFSNEEGNYYFDFIPIGNYVIYARDPSENSNYSSDAAPIIIENTKTTNAPDLILRKAAEHVVIFRDLAPWSSPDAIPNILIDIGFTEGLGINQYEIKNSNDINNIDSFDPTWAIIIEGDQSTSFYDIYKANSEKFDSFVNNGGTLFWVACDNGWNGGNFTGTLPGGVTWRDYYDNYNEIINKTHPLLYEFPNERYLYGNYASHGGFDNLEDSDIENPVVFIKESTSYEQYSTYIEYRYGNGRVIASTTPLEYYVENPNNDSEWFVLLLRRSIEYVFNMNLSPSNIVE